jgi:hypothetical protein
VAPKIKGKAIKPLYGLENYEDWVFLYIPPQFQFNQGPVDRRGVLPRAPIVTQPAPPPRPPGSLN